MKKIGKNLSNRYKSPKVILFTKIEILSKIRVRHRGFPEKFRAVPVEKLRYFPVQPVIFRFSRLNREFSGGYSGFAVAKYFKLCPSIVLYYRFWHDFSVFLLTVF